MPEFVERQRTRWHDKIVRAVELGVSRALSRHSDEAEQRAARRHEELLAALRAWERRQRRDVFTALDLEAARSSAELLRREVDAKHRFFHPHETLRHALRQAPAEGLTLEFGVASGATLQVIREERPAGAVYGFDSFEGLPEDWRFGFDAGEFATPTRPQVPGAELVVGLFADTLPGFLADHPGPVAFVHVDCDLYSSTRTVLDAVGPRFVDGTVLVFDEYYNHPGWQDFEYRAWQEYVAATGVTFDYLGVTMDDEQVSVRITGLPA